MLLNSVILILREVLEAAMLISVLLALSLNLRVAVRWCWYSLPLALLGAVLFAFNLDLITDTIDGAGQEIANAGLQGLVYCLTVVIVGFTAATGKFDDHSRTLAGLMLFAVACAVIREGSEVLIYISGFAAVEEHRTAVYAGSAIGAGIGLSLGVLLFSALRALSTGLATKLCMVLLALIGSGMVMQSVTLLEQVDWLPAGQAIWDSSWLVTERSVAGELLYAVFGYESTPGFLQVVFYLLSIAITLAVYFLSRRWGGHAVVQ